MNPCVGIEKRRAGHFSTSTSASHSSRTGARGSPCHVTVPRSRIHGRSSSWLAGIQRGRVVARLVPASQDDERPWMRLRGTVTWHGDPLAPVLEEWDADVEVEK